MLLAQHDHVIQTLAPDGAHQPFRKRVLPRTLRRRQHFSDAHVAEAIPETFAIDLVPVSYQVGWCRVFGERFQNLLSGPSPPSDGHVEMNYPTPTMGQHHQHEQHSKGCTGHRKEIDGNQLVEVVVEEGLPGLRRGWTLAGQESRHRSFRHIDTELEQLAVDARRSPRAGCPWRPSGSEP